MKKPLLTIKPEILKEVKANRKLRLQLAIKMQCDITTIERWIEKAPHMLTDQRALNVMAKHAGMAPLDVLVIDPSLKASLLNPKQPA